MNIIQFWLIDSIVKAAGPPGVSLDIEASEALDHPDREPLFQADSDDEGDDAPPYDVNNPHSQTTSERHARPSPGARRTSSSISSASRLHKKPGSKAPMELQEYPPSLTHSIDTASPSEPSPTNSKMSASPKQRRGPPTPINVPPNKPVAIASNSPWVSSAKPAEVKPAPSSPSAPKEADTIKDAGWDNWDDDDWGERVGEEEWTGNRLSLAAASVEERWREPISS